MSKFGKVLGPVVALLSVAVAVLAVLIALRDRQARYRSQILAQSLNDTAAALDSESGIADKANFRKAGEDNKESGSLGWPAAKAAGDLTSASNSYKDSANQVVTLANNVIEQRDFIIDKLVGASALIECPEASRPNADALKNLNSYADGTTTSLETYLRNRVARDNSLKAALNAVLSKMGVKRSYTGEITTTGRLSANDQGALEDAAKCYANLTGNFRTYQQFLRELSRELHGVRVNGVTWASSTNERDFSLVGTNSSDAAAISTLLGGFRTDVRTVKAQMGTIDGLKKNISDLKDEVAAKEAKIAELNERLVEVSKLVETIYNAGGMEYDRHQSEPAKTSYSEISQELSGRIVKLDSQYGYAVIDLSRSMIIDGVKLGVYRGGQFLGLLKVIEAGEFNSMATVVSGKAAEMAVGDTLVIASDALQDSDILGK